MASIIDDLKAKARILQDRATAGDPLSLARLHAQGIRELPIKRADCLRAIARELGFDGWPHASNVISGEETRDFGKLLYPHGAAAHWNIWSASYDEAERIRGEHGGYLLAYKHQFFIADRYFIETLGLDPEDPDWEAIGRDWVKPRDASARTRLYTKLIRARYEALQ